MSISLSDLEKFEAAYSLRGDFAASCNLTDAAFQYLTNLLYTPIKIQLTSTAYISGISGDSACLGGTLTCIRGVIRDVKNIAKIEGGFSELSVRSYFAKKIQQAVNTEVFNSTTSTVLNSVAHDYGGILPAYTSLTLSNNNSFLSNVSGNNLLEELSKIAETGYADVFIQVGGILTAENWKDHNSAVDVVIPDEAVLSAERNVSTPLGPSVIVVRGRMVSEYEAGLQILSRKNVSGQRVPDTNKPPEKQGMRDRCEYIGLGTPRLTTKMLGVHGTKNNLKNAGVRITEGPNCSASSASDIRQLTGTFQYIKNIEDYMFYTVVAGDCGVYLSAGSHSFEWDVLGRKRHKGEYESPDMQQKPLEDNIKRNTKIIENAVDTLTGSPKSRRHSSLQGTFDPDKLAGETQPYQVGAVVVDTALANEFGISYEQLSNPYIPTPEVAFNIAVRRFQEYKMRRNTWTVSTVFLPCLRINDVVQFKPPGRSTVTGLLTEIRLNWDSAPNATMTLAVESFEELGSSTYTSGNLLMYPEFIAAGGGRGWVANSYVRVLRGYIGIITGGVIQQTLYDMEVGATYTFYVDVQQHTAGSFSISLGGSSQPVTTGGTHSVSWVATSTSTTAKISGVIGKWYILGARVIKTVSGK